MALWRRLWTSEIVFFGILCLASFLHCYKIFDLRPDPDRWDEISVYIDHINRPWLTILADIEVSPLYTAWYAFLHLFTKDYLALYYLNSLLLTFSPPPLLYLVARRHGFTRLESFLGFTALFLFAPLITINRFPNHFLFFALCVGFIVISFLRSFYKRLLLLTGLVLISIYIRPEMILAFGVLFILLLYFSLQKIRQKSFHSKHLVALALLLAAGAASQKLLKQTTTPGQPLKSEFVFQIFNIERLTTFKVPNPNEQYQIRYGHPHSIGEALFNNPIEFTHHIAFSANRLLEVAIYTLRSFQYLLQWPSLFWLGGLILFLIFGQWHYTREHPRRRWRSFLLLSLLLSIPFITSGLILGSQPRYLIPMFACGFFWLSWLLTPKISAKGLLLPLGLLALQVLAPLSFPREEIGESLFNYYGEDAGYEKTCGASLEAAEILKALKAKNDAPQQLRVLSQTSLYEYVDVEGLYLCGTADCCTEGLSEAEFSIPAFRNKVYNFTAFIGTPNFPELGPGEFISDKKRLAFLDLATSPEKYGFKQIKLKCPELTLLVDEKYLKWRMGEE